MPQSLASVLVHIVFSTRERRPFLDDPVLRDEAHRYVAGVSNRLGCQAIKVGGVGDHVQLLAFQARVITLADWVKELKRASGVWLRSKGPALAEFQWQRGFGAFSVSAAGRLAVERYVRTQEERHRRTTFEEEFRELLTRHDVAFDERYVWD